MNSIYNYTLVELENYLVSIGEKKYRAKQIYDWLYIKKVTSFSEMTNLSKESMENISKNLVVDDIKVLKKEVDKDVVKYLFGLHDNETIEAVLMFHDYGNSICVSSQIGCNMGCKFCNSGKLKKIRNLEANEIILQILKVEADLKLKISHVVVMGIGEPFDNYDNVCKMIEIINNPFGLSIGSRHITVSTCGIVPKILEFSDFPYQVNLAISLHAPNDELRSSLMPINNAYKIKDLMDAIKVYIRKTNRRVTFEYILLNNINDTDSCAHELVNLLRGLNAYVNLIPYNSTDDLTYSRSSDLKIKSFYDILIKEGIGVTIRREFGSKISAACGQLRANNRE